MEFRVLGALEVVGGGGRRVLVTAKRPRALLAVLLVRVGRVVSVDELVEAVWGSAVPEYPRAALHTCVTRLRTALGGEVEVEAAVDGYRIVVDESDVDMARFLAGTAKDDADGLRAALGLWRGEPFADVESDYLHREVVPSLVERRLATMERLFELDHAEGRYDIPGLHELTAKYPVRERFWAQLMLALHHSGRQAEALAAYSDVRRKLVDELGVEPGAHLRRAHQTVLAGTAEEPDGWVIHRQLPLDVNDFTGREDELGWLRNTIHEQAVVTISGPPGIGKSALAIHAAHRLAPDFPDGQWFLRLAGASAVPRQTGDLLAELLGSAGVSPRAIPNGIEQRAALLRSRLADRKVLLVFDDAGTVGQVVPLLPGHRGSAVIITSRSDLGGLTVLYGGRRLQLEPLAPQQAYRLLARIVGPDRCAEAEQATADLADLCGRLPLALRIAAANLAGRPRLKIGKYAADLRTGDRVRMLSTTGIAVRTAFDASYQGLDEPQRHAFCLLGLVPGPDISLAGAAALFGCDADDAADELDKLIAANLVEYQASDRYRFHDLIRLYATDRAREDESEATRAEAVHRLFEWYLRSAHAACVKGLGNLYVSPLPLAETVVTPMEFKTTADALGWLEAEHLGHMAAIEHAAKHGPARYSWLLTDAFRPFVHTTYRIADYERAADLGLDCARQAGDRRAEAAMLLARGAMESISGRTSDAIDRLGRSRDLAMDLGDTNIAAAAILSISALYGQIGQPLDVMRMAGQVFALIREGLAEAGQREANTAFHYAKALHDAGRLRESAALFQRLLSGEIGPISPLVRSYAHALLCLTYHDLGDHERTAEMMELATGISGVVRIGLGDILVHLVSVQRESGDLDKALIFLDDLAAGVGENASMVFTALADIEAAAIYHEMGRSEMAVRRYADGRLTAEQAGTKWGQIRAMAGMALAADKPGLAMDAVLMAREQGLRLLEAKALNTLAQAEFAHGNLLEARLHATEALALHREFGCRAGQGHALTVLGQVAATEGEPGAADLWRQALAIYEEIGSPSAAAVVTLLARALAD